MAAICDINVQAAERMAEKHAVDSVYSDYRTMLAEVKPDIVSICTANHLHRQMAVDALASGAHVHLEKPIALNGDEAAEIVAARNLSGKQVMIGLNSRFTPETAFMMRCIGEGFFGDIYHAKCGWKRRNGIPGKGVWFTDREKAGGGPLIDLGVHYLDLVLHFMDFPEITRVSGAAYCKFADQDHRLRPGYKNMGDGLFNVEDMAVGTLYARSGATVQFEFSWASNIEKETKYYEIMGTKGGAFWRDGELRLFTELAKTGLTLSPDLSLMPPVQGECAHFADCVRTGKPVMAPAEHGLALMRVIDGIYRSAAQDCEVRLQAADCPAGL
jgi:predicted dehydrogenase